MWCASPSLLATFSASGVSQPGNASLEILRHIIGGQLRDTFYGLYTDSGKLYSGDGKRTLVAAIAQHANLATIYDSRVQAAARYAATGDLATARARMIDATPPDAFIGRAAQKTTPIRQALQDQINNGTYRKLYLQEVGWEPALDELGKQRGWYP